MSARFTIAVAGGKGGVGKSTVTLNLGLALHGRGATVGILDADLYGPDIPAMLGLTRTRDAERWTIWSKEGAGLIPIERRGLKLMSAGFLLGDGQVMPWASQTQRHDVFPRVTRERSIWEDGIERLASIPLDPALARVNGVPFAFAELAEALERQLA